MNAEEVVHWIQEHVTDIRMNVRDSFEPDAFTVKWINREGHSHVDNCRNLTELATRITEEEENVKVSLEQRDNQD